MKRSGRDKEEGGAYLDGRARAVGRPPERDAEKGVGGLAARESLGASGADDRSPGTLQGKVEQAGFVGVVLGEGVANERFHGLPVDARRPRRLGQVATAQARESVLECRRLGHT